MTIKSASNPMSFSSEKSLPISLLLCLSASGLIAASSQVSIPVPFSPVPISLQPHAVILMGMLLGPRLGTLAVAMFLLEGCMGLPVFANGHFGPLHLIGPTGGYLLSYLAVPLFFPSPLVGEGRPHGNADGERGTARRSLLQTLLPCLTASFFILGCGTLWLSVFMGGLQNAFIAGFAPFIVGDAVKSLVIATGYTSITSFLSERDSKTSTR